MTRMSGKLDARMVFFARLLPKPHVYKQGGGGGRGLHLLWAELRRDVPADCSPASHGRGPGAARPPTPLLDPLHPEGLEDRLRRHNVRDRNAGILP